jgi:hypothetical protein
MKRPVDPLGLGSGEGEPQGTACLSRARLADGLGTVPVGLPGGSPGPAVQRAGHEPLLRSTAFLCTHPEAEPPARPGAPKPAAQRPSIGAARPREATGHRRSAVLPFAARSLIWAAGGRAAGRRPESPTGAYRPAARPFVPPRRSLEETRSRPPLEDEHDRALRLRTASVRDQERAPIRMGAATARTLGLRPIQSWVHPQRFHILRLSGHARRRIE